MHFLIVVNMFAHSGQRQYQAAIVHDYVRCSGSERWAHHALVRAWRCGLMAPRAPGIEVLPETLWPTPAPTWLDGYRCAKPKQTNDKTACFRMG